jgi:hypothetical protein
MKNNRPPLSEDSLPFAELVEMSTDIEGAVGSTAEGVRMVIEEVTMSIPVQLETVRDDSGQLQIGGIPPEHYVETSFLPVFHQLRLKMTPIHQSLE